MLYGFTAKYFTDGHWALSSDTLNGCVSQGGSLEEAVRQLEVNELEWIKTAEKYGIAVPEQALRAEEKW